MVAWSTGKAAGGVQSAGFNGDAMAESSTVGNSTWLTRAGPGSEQTRSGRERLEEARPPDLHQIPNPGAGKGVPYEPLPDKAAEDRDGARPLPHRKADQDMVPEPQDEAQEGDTGHQGAQRAGEASPGAEGGGSGGGGASRPELVDQVRSGGPALPSLRIRDGPRCGKGVEIVKVPPIWAKAARCSKNSTRCHTKTLQRSPS